MKLSIQKSKLKLKFEMGFAVRIIWISIFSVKKYVGKMFFFSEDINLINMEIGFDVHFSLPFFF